MRNFEDPKLNEFEARIEAATSNDEKIEISREAMTYLRENGQTIDVDQISSVAQFATSMVETVLESIIMTADELRTDVVPVEFIRDLKGRVGPLISQKIFEATDLIGVPLDYGDIPDDLSGLLG